MASTINANTSGGLISTADTSGILALQTAGTTAVTVTASQTVGIGTTSPAAVLDVKGTNPQLIVRGNTGVEPRIRWYSDATSRGGISSSATYGLDINSDTSMRFYTNGGSGTTTPVIIDTAGTVGIGITPSAWETRSKVLQAGLGSALRGRADVNLTSINTNWYTNSSGTNTYINTDYAANYTQYAGAHSWASAPSGTAGTAVSFTPVLAVEKDKSLALQGASSQTGTGITFPATQSASSDANTLDDYEEGTWTPVVTSQSGSLTSYTSSGTYTKIGRTVTIQCAVTVGTPGTASGQMLMSGLPFGTLSGLQYMGVTRETVFTGNIFFGETISSNLYIQNSSNGGVTWTSGYKYETAVTYQTS